MFQGGLKLSFSGDCGRAPGRDGFHSAQPTHSAEALEDTLVIDVFTPPRRDWKQKQDAYLRQGKSA